MASKKRLVVLTGAGISADSGLKTFRDADGLWEGYDVTEVATPGAWHKNPDLVLQFYNERRKAVQEASPNRAHYGLAELEEFFEVDIITQNIDDLHERGGSSRILHLHGEILKMRSERNESLVYPIDGDMIPGALAEDGARLRPHIVWFEEPVPLIEMAASIVRMADIFVVIGTSLVVYPAAGLVNFAGRNIPRIVLDKKIPSNSDLHGVTSIEKSAAEGMEDLKKLLLELT